MENSGRQPRDSGEPGSGEPGSNGPGSGKRGFGQRGFGQRGFGQQTPGQRPGGGRRFGQRSRERNADSEASAEKRLADRFGALPGSLEEDPDAADSDGREPGSLLITAITPQRKRGRVSVFINDEFVLGAEEAGLASIGWRVGMVVTEDLLRRAKEELEYRAARTAAEQYLGYRARSEHELKQKLEQKGYSPDAVQHVLRHVREQGYINDEAYAASYTEIASGRRMGRRRVAAELKRRGIDSEVVEAAVNTLDDETEKVLALEFATRRARSMAHLDDAARFRRLAAALQRRGFSHSTIKAVVEQVIHSEEAD